MGDRESGLAAGGRGPSEELGMPVPDDRTRLSNRFWGSDSDQDHDGRGNRNRRRGVHRNAQRAMVGIVVQRMNVRHLDQGHHRQQRQTQQGSGP